MSNVKGLKCKECGRAYAAEAKYVCEFCFGPLEVAYDYEGMKGRVTRASIAAGPASIWRYAPLLPARAETAVTLHEGFTPLLHAERLGRALGLDRLYVKNDAMNPTFSFKDRVVSVAASKAREFGFDTLACASTGNLAGAVSAYGAVAGLKAIIFIPADLEPEKIAGAAIYGARVVAVRGSYDDVNRLCSELSNARRWAFVNINLRPYYSEGSKSLAYEVAEQLGWRAPDHVVVPIASGSLFTKIHKGFQELRSLGLIPEAQTRMSGAQGEGCAPVVAAFKTNAKAVKPVRPNTLAKSIAIGNPADGLYAVDIMRRTGGGADAATDAEMVEGIEMLARTEGVFTETAGGVTVAVLKKLAAAGVVRRDELVVAYITGNGFKTLDAVTDRMPERVAIDPSVKAFEASISK